MSAFKIGMLVFLWLGLASSAIFGFYYSPNYRVRRREHPKEFWIAWAWGAAITIIATLLLLRTPV
jgi:hypothetical protein